MRESFFFSIDWVELFLAKTPDRPGPVNITDCTIKYSASRPGRDLVSIAAYKSIRCVLCCSIRPAHIICVRYRSFFARSGRQVSHCKWFGFILLQFQVYQLGVCDDCQRRMSDRVSTRWLLFSAHVNRVATHAKSVNPSLRVLIWDDMLRGSDVIALESSRLKETIEPMVWFYGAQGFPGRWVVRS